MKQRVKERNGVVAEQQRRARETSKLRDQRIDGFNGK